MQRWVMVAMVVTSAGLALGCGDSDDSGSTIRAVCDTTCERVLECNADAFPSQGDCNNQCLAATGDIVCDEVVEANLTACLSGIESRTCEQLAAGIPAICDAVCLVRVSSRSELMTVPLTFPE